MAGQRFHIQYVVLDRAGIGQPAADLLIVEFRPEDARRVEQQKAAVHRDPLLATRDAGAVLRLCALAPGDLIDEGRFSHVRDADDHQLQRAAGLSLVRIALQLLRQHGADGGHEAVDAAAALAVRAHNGHALRLPVILPDVRSGRIGQIDAVEDHHAGLLPADGVNVRVPAGKRDACVHDLADGVHELEVSLHIPPGLGHVARIPLDIHAVIHCPALRSVQSPAKRSRRSLGTECTAPCR